MSSTSHPMEAKSNSCLGPMLGQSIISPTRRRFSRRYQDKMSLMNYISTRQWQPYNNLELAQLARNHPPFMLRLDHCRNLPVHDGCVNTICWNASGEYILSGSDDCNLCITKPGDMFAKEDKYTVLHKIPTYHSGNIFSARFMPNSADTTIVSCSNDGPIIIHDINATDPSEPVFNFNCHSETIYEVVPVPDEDKVFLSCGEDKTIRLFDLRVHRTCTRAGTCPHIALIRNSKAITTLQLHPTNPNLMLAGRADGMGLVYDRRKLPVVTKFTRERAHADRLAGNEGVSFRYLHPLEGVVSQFTVPDMDEKSRFTSLCYNKDGSEVLASYTGDYIYLFNHDRSSRFERAQTITKPNSDQTGDNKNGTSQSRPKSSPRSARIARIRVRGDWSDTGINSVPLSSRSADSEAPRRSTSFLEQVAVTLSRRRQMPTEILARPIRAFPLAGNGEEEEEQREEEEEEREAEEQDGDEEEGRVSTDDDDNGTLIDDEGEDERVEIVRQYAESTINDLVEEANEQAQQMMDSNEEWTDVEMIDDDQKAGRMGLRASAKEKLKRTSELLKNMYKNIPTFRPIKKYQGHRNCRTSIKESIFWGDDYVMSGSDCGRIFVWEKDSAKLVTAFQGDQRVVNCLAPNPSTYVLASSGIDYDIKLWSISGEENSPILADEEELKRIVENNGLMLEESRYTLSVPPHLFFRVLASLVQSSR